MRAIIRLYRDAYSGLPREVWLISLVGFTNRAGTMVMAFLGLWLNQVHGLSPGHAAQFLALWGLGSCAGVPLGGRLADRIGPVPVQMLSFVGVACAFMALPELGELWLVGGVTFLVGLLGEACRPANAAMIATYCTPEQRTQAYALHRLAINAGWTIGPVAGGFLSQYHGWTLVFTCDAATCALSAGLLWWWFGTRRTHAAASDDDAVATGQSRSPWSDGLFLAFVGAVFCVALLLFQFVISLPIYLGGPRGWSNDEIGLVLAINPILITLLEMIIVRRLTRPNPLRIVALGTALMACGIGMLWIHGGFAWIAACLIVITVGEMLESPFTAGFVANRAPASARGRYMGVYGLAYSVAFILAPLVGGGVAEAIGWNAVWIGCGAAGLIASVAFLAVARRVDQRGQGHETADGDSVAPRHVTTGW